MPPDQPKRHGPACSRHGRPSPQAPALLALARARRTAFAFVSPRLGSYAALSPILYFAFRRRAAPLAPPPRGAARRGACMRAVQLSRRWWPPRRRTCGDERPRPHPPAALALRCGGHARGACRQANRISETHPALIPLPLCSSAIPAAPRGAVIPPTSRHRSSAPPPHASPARAARRHHARKLLFAPPRASMCARALAVQIATEAMSNHRKTQPRSRKDTPPWSRGLGGGESHAKSTGCGANVDRLWSQC